MDFVKSQRCEEAKAKVKKKKKVNNTVSLPQIKNNLQRLEVERKVFLIKRNCRYAR